MKTGLASSRAALFAATALFLGLFIYGPSLRGDFLWDDDDYVTQNQALRSPEGLKDIWLKWGATPQYYPLVFSSFWVEHQAWGDKPAGYRINNLLLHAANALLVFLILNELSVAGAWLAALLFLVHPVHVETVAWISERKNVLSTFFFLLSFFVFWRGARSGADAPLEKRRIAFALSLVLFMAALLSKTVACTLPAALFLTLLWKNGRVERNELLSLAAFCLVGAPLALLTIGIERHVVGMAHFPWPFDAIDRVFLAGRILWFYPAKLLWPSPLMFFYPKWEGPVRTLLSGAGFAAFVALLILFFRARRARGPLLGALLYAVMIAPALGFFPAYPMRYSYVADHFQYLASVPVLVLFAGGAAYLAGRFGLRPSVRRLSAGAVVLCLALLARDHTGAFMSRERLWEDAAAKNPASAAAHNNLGVVRLEKQDFAGALSSFEKALAAGPGASAYTGAGIASLRLGKLDEAERYFDESLALEPRRVETHVFLAETYLSSGRRTSALDHAFLARQLQPDYFYASFLLGRIYFDMKRFDEARAAFLETQRLRPGYPPLDRYLSRLKMPG